MLIWELIVACNTCGDKQYIEEMYIVPDVGKVVCKACSLKEETQVLPLKEMDDSNPDNGW
jgi:formylmethanofuran dehydrogenase subunit E